MFGQYKKMEEECEKLRSENQRMKQQKGDINMKLREAESKANRIQVDFKVAKIRMDIVDEDVDKF